MSFLSPFCSPDGHLAGNEDYDDAFGGGYENSSSTYKRDKNYYSVDLEAKLFTFGVMTKKDVLKIKVKTEKAYLFEINGIPLFWVPKALVNIMTSPKRFYVNKCFDIKKALTS